MKNLGKLNAAIYRNLQSILNLRLSDTEIRSGQYDFFSVIARHEGLTQKEITENLLVEKSTTAKAVKDLTQKGLIRKVKDQRDGRRELLYLTEKGKELAAKVCAVYKESMGAAFSSLSPEEQIQLRELFSRVLDSAIKDKKRLQCEMNKVGCRIRAKGNG